jgi:uncharacterized protein YjiK
VFDLQLREVSGICERAAGDGRPRQLLAIGDDSHHVLVGDLDPEVPGSFARHDLEPLLDEAGVRAGGSSQWEGIDTDETGRVFVLREVPGTVFVFDPELRALLHVLALTVEDDPGEQQAWEADENALGEGLLLLRNGHLFVVKEEKPRQLLEFGLPGERAQGLRGDLLVAGDGEFPAPEEARATFHMLSAWDLGGEALARIGDLSDVAIGPDGRVYILSDESRCIARLQPTVPPEGGIVAVDRIWGLPERLHQPEGLVITGDWDVLVATDHEEQRDNLFLLGGLRP